jgi:hypothetical protein
LKSFFILGGIHPPDPILAVAFKSICIPPGWAPNAAVDGAGPRVATQSSVMLVAVVVGQEAVWNAGRAGELQTVVLNFAIFLAATAVVGRLVTVEQPDIASRPFCEPRIIARDLQVKRVQVDHKWRGADQALGEHHTSNIGSHLIQSMTDKKQSEIKEAVFEELKNHFRPEFLNRIDDIIVFNTLKEEHVKEIVKIELIKLTDRLTKIKYNFRFDESIVDMISKVGFDEMYGARPLKRAIQDKIEDYISEEVLKGELQTDHNYTISVEEEQIKITEEKKVKKTKKEVK